MIVINVFDTLPFKNGSCRQLLNECQKLLQLELKVPVLTIVPALVRWKSRSLMSELSVGSMAPKITLIPPARFAQKSVITLNAFIILAA